MNDLAAKPALVAGNMPRAIVPTDIDQVWRVAEIVHKSGLAPRDMDTKEKITVALMHGLEIGLPPMMAIQKIAIVNGRPAVWGDAVPGIALSTGQLEDWIERFDGEGDRIVATCIVKRKGIKTPKTATFSVADAKRADLWDDRAKVRRRKKDGTFYEGDNDSPWFRYPLRMLQMRARVAFRDLFADAFSGLYIAEELIGRSDEATPPPAPTASPALIEAQAIETTAPANENETQAEPQEAGDGKKPLPPLARRRGVPEAAPQPPETAPAQPQGFAFAAFAEALKGVKSIEDVNAVYDRLVSPISGSLTQEVHDEIDSMMRIASAEYWVNG